MKRSRAVGTISSLATLGGLIGGSVLFLFALAPLSATGSRAAPAAPTAVQAASAPDLRAELTALLAAQSADWSRGDVAAFASIYADDATFVSPSGMTQGRAALVERYRKRYPDRAAMGTLALEILELRPGGESAASVVARWTLSYPDKPPATGLTLLVFHRLAAGWRIVEDASM